MRILIGTDASPDARQALDFGALLARSLGADVTLMGVAERQRLGAAMENHLAEVASVMGDGLRVTTRLRYGHPAEEILKEAEEGAYDVLVVGAQGRRRIPRFLLGDTALRLARQAPLPLLLVRNSRPSIGRVLICTAGGEHGGEDAKLGGRIAAGTGASVVILHVMSQVPISPQAPLEALRQTAGWHIEHETPEGQHLASLLEVVRDQGVQAEARIRWGLVVDEILAEARGGDYDLVVIGAHWPEGLLRFLLDDVTEAIIGQLRRPVLVVR